MIIMIKTNMTEDEIDEVMEPRAASVDYEANVHGIMMEMDPVSFLDQHEKNVKRNMENLMKFMRK